ncbi:unnamed protein product [Lactuca saligna]|uniref:Uncharacterized protein n=1 Tax=Lactuca saligna TaxID=75948 RepID=A0AA36E413_LACSI|nr:unnamed protein product [Lactuca saligna]
MACLDDIRNRDKISERYGGYMGLGVVSLPERRSSGIAYVCLRKRAIMIRQHPYHLPPISANDESYEYGEEQDHPDEEFGRISTTSSPYPNSTSHQDHEETREEDPTMSE